MRQHKRFITVEGGEGAGKTSVLKDLHQALIHDGYDVLMTREPGGSVIAEKIRDVILDPAHTEMDDRTEALLYAAARRQHLTEKVLPHLEKGGVVLCDRYVDSSLVYQGGARGIGIEAVRELNHFATEAFYPGKTFYFDVSPEVGLGRIAANKGREFNRLDGESLAFHEQVRSTYLALADAEPSRITVIDAERTQEEVLKDVLQKTRAHLG